MEEPRSLSFAEEKSRHACGISLAFLLKANVLMETTGRGGMLCVCRGGGEVKKGKWREGKIENETKIFRKALT